MGNKKEFNFGNRKIGKDHPVFIIAEVSGNHNQDYNTAEKVVRAACEAGVDAVKIQTYSPDTMTINSDKKWFKAKWMGKETNLYELYRVAHTPLEWQPKLKKVAESYGIPLFSTPFDETAVDFLEKMNVAVYKVASFEVVDINLLKKIASTGKPVIMSRGMASLEELELAYKTLKENGCPSVAILHCVSAYPAKPENMNLATIPDLEKRFDAVIGLSDHTLTTETAIAGAVLGAKIIEKHITLNRADKTIDSEFSLEPEEFKELIRKIRNVEKSIGKPNYNLVDDEKEQIRVRRSLFVVKDMKKGEVLTKENVRSIRPGYGLAPKYFDGVLGKKIKQDVERGTPLSFELIEE
jgi:pseudaminic acid synthase